MNSGKILVELSQVSVRIGDAYILSNIDWVLRSGENWAILGPNGAGKTTFLSLVRGDIWPTPEIGKRLYHVNGEPQFGPIGFHEKTGSVSSDLLDRYRTNGWNLTGLEVVCTGFNRTAFLYEKPTDSMLNSAQEVLAMLNLEELSDRRILTMSFGEAKKVLIARALVHQPDILFIDEFCAGLDARSKDRALSLIQLVAEQGKQIICAAHNVEEVPDAITNLLTLESGRIIACGPMAKRSVSTNTGPVKDTEHTLEKTNTPKLEYATGGPTLIEIEKVDMVVGGSCILKRIDWTVKNGENWALLGPNGSGKTTLLKLIVGEERPVWGGVIRRFGKDDLQTIDEIRRRISLVTPDFQADHMLRQTALEMVLSGFYGSVGLPHESTTEEQILTVQSWFKKLGIQLIENRQVCALSYGQIRMLLIMRALVTNPRLLILDEPTTGLDRKAKNDVWKAVNQVIEEGTSVIYVTHDHMEIWPFISHVAILRNGRMIFKGERKQWENSVFSISQDTE
ncbi:MAG: ABC transporter ATP-binding protein [Desulfomonilaceae bacterium]